MGLIKSYYKKIVAYGLLILGFLSIPVCLLLHLKIKALWFSIFFIVVGLTMIPFAKEDK